MEEKKQNSLTNISVILVSLAFIGMSALMIFVEGTKTIFLCFAICAVAIIAGIVLIVRYFMTDAYQNVNAYGFSFGTLLIILGICGMVKAEQMAAAFIVILGIILLLLGVMVLQYSLDLRRMKDVIWAFSLVVSILILICSIMVIVQPFADKIDYGTIAWWMILCSGGVGVLANLYTMIKVTLFNKKEKANETETMADNTVETEDISDAENKEEIAEEKVENGDI